MKSRLFIIVISFFVFKTIFAQKDVKVLSSNNSSITFEYTPQYSEIKKDIIDGKEYFVLSFEGCSGFSERLNGKIQLPHKNIQIGVPEEFGNTLQIISAQFTLLNGKLLPSADKKDLTSEAIASAERDFANAELVTFGDFGYARDFPIQDILITPVQYNPKTSTIKKYTKIIVRINFVNSSKPHKTIVSPLLNEIVLNYDIAKYWGKVDKKFNKTTTFDITGTWHRFLTPKEGIYKITKKELSSLGIDAASVDPRTIKIYNNGGYPLAEKIPVAVPYGFTENAILVIGEEDGKFDDNDYILFYGRGNDFWEYNFKEILRHHHPFSKHNYYWITFGGSKGKRMQKREISSGAPDYNQTKTVAFKFSDEDKINIGRSGRDYWGDEFNSTNRSRTYINTLNGRINNLPVNYRYRFANASKNSLTLTISESGQIIRTQTLYGYGSNSYSWGVENRLIKTAEYSGIIPDNRSTLKFDIAISGAESKVYLDYFEISYVRDLKVDDDELIFFAEKKRTTVNYHLTNFSNSDIFAFDITDFDNAQIISSPDISGGEISFTLDEHDNGKFSKYITLTDKKFKKISEIEKIEIPQSIINGREAEYIIITDEKFSEEAKRLAEYRKNDAPVKYSTKVVFVSDILNEFSCGMMDPTAIRNFLKYSYDNWQVKPFYVLLFGDGDYDYLNVEKYGKNYVPTYQTKESLNELASYPTDDFYSRISGNDDAADLAIGRLNIQSVEDAKNVVDKIINYEKPDNGIWKNIITLVADDGLTSKGNDYALHTKQSETLAATRIPGFMDLHKIYLAAYPTVQTGFGRRKPEVNKAIIDAINQGTLILNYVGHGNPNVWAHEVVFERISTIPALKNKKLFFLTAATCDFGRYDDPTVQSSTEEMLLLKDAGMIGGFSAARVVYSYANEALNLEFYSHLLSDSLEEMANNTVGKAFYLTKMKKTIDNDEKFHLFGDPAIRLNIPKQPASIEKVNGQNLTTNVQLKALSKVNVEGAVQNYNGNINPDYNGEAVITVYDSDIIKPLPELGNSSDAKMIVPGGVIFRGRATISNGKFNTQFTVPQDISYENRNGKITAYITDGESDGIGFTKKVVIGGTDSTVVNDGEGPEIEISFDNACTPAASLVNRDFTIVLNLQDETGLNTTGTGIGHKLKGIIDDDLSNEIDFTNYFVGDLDAEGKSGKVTYKITDFKLGEHKIKVTAWDVFNNPGTHVNYFTVVNSEDVVLKDVVNYPNPFSSNTTFIFQHNIEEPVDAKIKIYTIAGRLIKNIEEYGLSDKYVKIDWDGRDEDGSEIANGTYLYKVIVKSISGKKSRSVLGKLAVIH